jgi:hypothetical protein
MYGGYRYSTSIKVENENPQLLVFLLKDLLELSNLLVLNTKVLNLNTAVKGIFADQLSHKLLILIQNLTDL